VQEGTRLYLFIDFQWIQTKNNWIAAVHETERGQNNFSTLYISTIYDDLYAIEVEVTGVVRQSTQCYKVQYI